MKKWLIPVASMIAVFATAGTVAGFALAGGGSDAADRPESEAPPTSSAVCAQDVPDCNDTIVIPNGGAETGDEIDGDVLPPVDRSDDGTSGDVPSIDPAIEVVPEPGIAVGEPHPGIPPTPPQGPQPM